MSRQFRSDDTDKWKYGYGSGVSGDYSSAGSGAIGGNQGTYWTTFVGTSGQTTGTLGGAWTWNGLCMIWQPRGSGVGTWEFNWIVVSSSTSATFLHPLQNTYTTSGASAAQIITILQWNNFTVNGGHTLTIPSWNGSGLGIFPVFVKGTFTVAGSITGSGTGFRSYPAGNYQNTGFRGEGSAGGGWDYSSAANGSGGGCGAAGTNQGPGGGGGHAVAGGSGTGGSVTRGTGGTAIGNAELTLLNFGGAGGSGGFKDSSTGSHTQNGLGGGVVVVVASNIVISGSISCVGTVGQNEVTNHNADGGGAGGSILLKCKTATLGTNLLTATGANGGTGGNGTAGAGSTGRIHIDYKTSYTGGTNPTIDARQDLTLDYLPSANFFAFFS